LLTNNAKSPDEEEPDESSNETKKGRDLNSRTEGSKESRKQRCVGNQILMPGKEEKPVRWEIGEKETEYQRVRWGKEPQRR